MDNKTYIKTAIQKLRDLGVNEILIEFDGSGDSGSIYSIDFYDLNNKLMKADIEVEYPHTKSYYKDGDWVSEETIKNLSVAEALESFCYDELERTGIDWYNNDGGFGQMRISIADKVEINLEVNQRYTEYNTDNFELSLED